MKTPCILTLTRSLAFLFLLGFGPLAGAASITFYVATNGNDTWTGRAAAPSGKNDGPFATLPAALKAARSARQTGGPPLREAVRIRIRGGLYELAEPIAIIPDDSGFDAEHPFIIEAYPGEKPILSGGRAITNWQPVPSQTNLWRAQVPEAASGSWRSHQLFVNGQRRQRARTPNEGFFRIQGTSPQDKPVRIRYQPGDIKRAWAEAGDVELIALLAWADLRMYIRAVDEANHVATLSGNPRPSNRENQARYYIENAPEALDLPGEWYLDRKDGVVTYWALPREDLRRARVTAPRLEDLLLLTGDLENKRPLRHVIIRGLTFSDTDWHMGPDGYADTQAAVATRGDIRAEAAVDCAFEDCVFTRLAGYALELGRGCQRIRVVGNEMFDLGAGGVRLGEAARRADPAELNHGHIITDNHLHHLGVVYPPAVGVFVMQSGQNRIAHNHIHHLYYTAISVGWNWGYQETPCRDNVVEFNHLHDIGQAMLSDMGAVYTLGIQRGTVIRHNLIHDIDSFTYGGWGLYPDEGSSEILFENNIVYRCKSAGFHQHYGRDNIVRNNIFAFNRENQLMRTRAEDHLSFHFTNNIVYFDSGDLLGSNWSNDNYRMDYNLYFDTRAGPKPDAMRFAGVTWEQWRRRGHDVHSLITDPRFIAPEKADFRLRSNSPAHQLGFQPIDVRAIGIRPKSKRAD